MRQAGGGACACRVALVGIALAAALTRFMTSLLFGVKPADLAMFGAVRRASPVFASIVAASRAGID